MTESDRGRKTEKNKKKETEMWMRVEKRIRKETEMRISKAR
jgi:hypothetical protein